MQTYRIIKMTDSLGSFERELRGLKKGDVVEGYPYLNWIGIKPKYALEFIYIDKECLEVYYGDN